MLQRKINVNHMVNALSMKNQLETHIDDMTCKCKPGFAEEKNFGDGGEFWQCYNIDDCPDGACQPGTCADLVLDYKCNSCFVEHVIIVQGTVSM